jgi:hypothetical protein
MPNGIHEIPRLVRQLYAIVDELARLFPGRRFTPDGHLVGSLGVVIAAHHYGLVPLPESTPIHDATSITGRLVQIKATQVGVVGLSAEPVHLLVLLLSREGVAEEVFNGPGSIAWNCTGPMQKNGQRPISLAHLRRLMNDVPVEERLARLEG